MEWKQKSKYYTTWEEYISCHPEIDEANQKAMRTRFEAYQKRMFQFIMTYLY